jgi:hypothetical protein
MKLGDWLVCCILICTGCSKPMENDFRSEVVNQLKAAGSDLKRSHKFDFYLYFPLEGSARITAENLKKDGYDVQVALGATGSNWLCVATKTLAPATAPLNEVGTRMEQVAREFKGEFDGWEAEVLKKD